MDRRDFLKNVTQAGLVLCTFGLVGCGKEKSSLLGSFAITRGVVTLYDTNAMALYYDGGLGPETGVIKVDYVLANKDVTLDFWHGHGGILHQFTVTPAHFHDLKQLKKVMVETNTVADHTHMLFIDPRDPQWRVAGAKPVQVPTDDERGSA